MEALNLYAGWYGILGGILTGLLSGLFFHRDSWLGGYETWPRRLTRLGHIAFFGLGFVNLAYAVTVRAWGLQATALASIMLVVGAASMPVVCFLAAWRKPLRHLFFIPVLSLLIGVVTFIGKDLHR